VREREKEREKRDCRVGAAILSNQNLCLQWDFGTKPRFAQTDAPTCTALNSVAYAPAALIGRGFGQRWALPFIRSFHPSRRMELAVGLDCWKIDSLLPIALERRERTPTLLFQSSP